MTIKSKVSELEFSRKVATSSPETSVSEVLDTLHQNKIGSIVICQDNKVTGIFTERDYILKIAGKLDHYKDEPISMFMTSNPVCVGMDNSILEVLELMHEGSFRHVIVINSTKQLEGIISIKDLVNFLIGSVKTLEGEISNLISAIL